jgi:hypothetical protein
LHLARPVFLLDFDQRLQFPQMVRVAESVQHTFQGVVRLPVVMHDNARDMPQQIAAPERDTVEGEQDSRGDVPPLRLAANPEAGLVHVLDWGSCHVVAHGIGEKLEALGAVLADTSDGRCHQVYPEEMCHEFGQTLLGQQLVVQQIEHECANPPAILYRCGDALMKYRPRLRAASRATAAVSAVFRDDQRMRFGEVEYLPGDMVRRHLRGQRRAARRAGTRIMVMVTSGVSVRRNVSPGWPFCPPVFLPDGSRRLLTRAGFFSPSLDGGLPLLLLFSPSRRSNSAMRAISVVFCERSNVISACNAAVTASLPEAAVASSCELVSSAGAIDTLTRTAS